jgi:hypothetical protein
MRPLLARGIFRDGANMAQYFCCKQDTLAYLESRNFIINATSVGTISSCSIPVTVAGYHEKVAEEHQNFHQ